jgi:hypothetical protein
MRLLAVVLVLGDRSAWFGAAVAISRKAALTRRAIVTIGGQREVVGGGTVRAALHGRTIPRR